MYFVGSPNVRYVPRVSVARLLRVQRVSTVVLMLKKYCAAGSMDAGYIPGCGSRFRVETKS